MALRVLVIIGKSLQLILELVKKAWELVMSARFKKTVDISPIISLKSKARIESLIASAECEGAIILLDGRGYKPENYPNRNFIY